MTSSCFQTSSMSRWAGLISRRVWSIFSGNHRWSASSSISNDQDKAFRISIAQRTEQNAFDEGEDCRRRADAQSDRGNYRQSESGALRNWRNAKRRSCAIAFTDLLSFEVSLALAVFRSQQ